jgi:hypothetical protein
MNVARRAGSARRPEALGARSPGGRGSFRGKVEGGEFDPLFFSSCRLRKAVDVQGLELTFEVVS